MENLDQANYQLRVNEVLDCMKDDLLELCPGADPREAALVVAAWLIEHPHCLRAVLLIAKSEKGTCTFRDMFLKDRGHLEEKLREEHDSNDL